MEINISWKVCRVCLAATKLTNIFKSSLTASIYQCSGVMVKSNDGLPHKICDKCLHMLKCAINFRTTCQKSDRYLKLLVQRTKSNSMAFPPAISNDDHLFEALIDEADADTAYGLDELPDSVTDPADEPQQQTQVQQGLENACASLIDKNAAETLLIDSTNATEMYEIFETGCLGEETKAAHASRESSDVESSESLMQQFVSFKQTAGTLKEEIHSEESVIEIDSQSSNLVTCEDTKDDATAERVESPTEEEWNYDAEDGKSLIEISDAIESENYETLESDTSMVEADDETLEPLSLVKTETEDIDEMEDDDFFEIDGNRLELVEKFEEEEHLEESEDVEYLYENETELPIQLLDNESVDNLSADAKKIKKKLPIYCNMCGNTFRTRNIYHLHMRIHRNERKYKCEFCPKSFNASCNLVSHMRTHTGEKPFECSFCQRRFSDRSTHIKHERIHTNEKPFVCNICSKAFALSTSLRTHEKVHSNLKPFNCEICAKAFKLPHQLKAHLNTQSHRAMSVKDS